MSTNTWEDYYQKIKGRRGSVRAEALPQGATPLKRTRIQPVGLTHGARTFMSAAGMIIILGLL